MARTTSLQSTLLLCIIFIQRFFIIVSDCNGNCNHNDDLQNTWCCIKHIATATLSDIPNSVNGVVSDIAGVAGAVETELNPLLSDIEEAVNPLLSDIADVAGAVETELNPLFTEISDQISSSFSTWFIEFEHALNEIYEELNDIEVDLVSQLKHELSALATIFGKELDATDFALEVFLNAVLDAVSFPNDWLDALSGIASVVETAKDALFKSDIISASSFTRRRNMLSDGVVFGDRRRNMLETGPIVEWDAWALDSQSMVWDNLGSLAGYNIDFSEYGDFITANDIECDAVCFNPTTATDGDQCIRVDLDITENKYPSITFDVYLYQRTISGPNNDGNVLSAGNRNNRGIFMHSSDFNARGSSGGPGIGIGTGHNFDGHEPLADNTWNRVVAVWDGDTSTAALYVNEDEPIIITNVDLSNNGEYLCLNARPNKENHDYFDGCIRSVKIYDYALTSEEVQESANAAYVRDCHLTTQEPTEAPSSAPSNHPTDAPTAEPTNAPSSAPSTHPTTSAEGCLADETLICYGTSAEYTDGSNYEGYVKNLLQQQHHDTEGNIYAVRQLTMLDTYITVEDAKKSYTDGNVYVRFHTTLTVFKALEKYCGIVGDVMDQCVTMKEGGACLAAGQWAVIEFILDSAIWILEMFIEAADIHDGILMTTQLDKVFKDQSIIIHNQWRMHQALMDVLNNNDAQKEPMKRIDNDDETYDGLYHIAKEMYDDSYHISKEVFDGSYHIAKEMVWMIVAFVLALIVLNALLIWDKCAVVASKHHHYAEVQMYSQSE
eukprot:212804_1